MSGTIYRDDLLKTPRLRFLRFGNSLAVALGILALATTLGARPADAEGEEILTGAFDAVTGVPFASIMLGIVKSGESPQLPGSLDARLQQLQQAVQDLQNRMRTVEARLGQLQDVVVRQANINRLRELQRIRAEIEEINAEMLTHPTEPSALAILEFRAHQQADLLKNNVDFDVWKWTDLDTATQTVRTRTFLPIAFELYSVALNTWMAAIELKNGTAPQRVVVEAGPALLQHAAFLRVRDGWHELLSNPPADAPPGVETLREHLYTSEYCRLEAVDTFSNQNGECRVASVCIDEMGQKQAETGRSTLLVQPAEAGVLCTFNPDIQDGLPGEDELRAGYGEPVMVALAEALDRLGHTGSLRPPFVGQFANTFLGPIFSVSYDRPLEADRGAAAGIQPLIARCPLFSGCVLGPDSSEAHWTLDGDTHRIVHRGSDLCLDVRNNAGAVDSDLVLWPCNGAASQKWTKRAITNQHYAIVNDASNLCASVTPVRRITGALRSFEAIDSARPMTLQPCTNSDAEIFSGTDSSFQGPH